MKNGFYVVCAILILVIAMVSCSSEIAMSTANENVDSKVVKVYDCDYHTFAWNTYITTTYNDRPVKISGNFLAIVTDPLTMKYEDNEELIGKADDTYQILDQDTHNIEIGDTIEVCVDGDFNVIGDSYTLYNAKGEYIGRASFSAWGYSGTIYDANNNVIATFSKNVIDDYTVIIYENDVLSDAAILMLTASYMSDYKYDNSNN